MLNRVLGISRQVARGSAASNSDGIRLKYCPITIPRASNDTSDQRPIYLDHLTGSTIKTLPREVVAAGKRNYQVDVCVARYISVLQENKLRLHKNWIPCSAPNEMDWGQPSRIFVGDKDPTWNLPQSAICSHSERSCDSLLKL